MPRLSFTEHPASVGESYWQHMGMALSFAGALLAAALACLVHAILPFAFEKTGSQAINDLYDRMVRNRDRRQRQRSVEVSADAELRIISRTS